MTTATATVATPLTLARIIGLMLRRLPLSLLRSLLPALFIMPLVWILHSYLIVFPNDGFQGGANWFLRTVLCLEGQVVQATVFWTLVGAIIPALVRGLWRAGGPFAYLGQVGRQIGRMIDVVRGAGRGDLPWLIGGAVALCLLQPLIRSTTASLMLLLFLLRGLVDLNERSFLTTLGRAAHYDFHRWFLKGRPWAPLPLPRLYLVATGMTAGVVLLAIPWLQNLAIGVALVLVAVYFIVKGGKSTGTTAKLILFFLVQAALTFVFTGTLLADDGGAPEFGIRTLGDALDNPERFRQWLATDAAHTCLRMGIPPALATWGGMAFGDAFVRVLTALGGELPGGTAVPVPGVPVTPEFPPVIPTTPTTPLPAASAPPADPLADYHAKYRALGWTYDEAAGGYTPAPGARDESGRIWCQPPWDIGGPYFMDAADYARMRQQQGEGKTWSNSDGWATDTEHSDYANQREGSRIAAANKSREIFEELARNDQVIASNDHAIRSTDVQLKIMTGQPLTPEDTRFAQAQPESWKAQARGDPTAITPYRNALSDDVADGLGYVQYGCDLGVGVCGAAIDVSTGGVGGKILTHSYNLTKNLAGAASEAVAEGEPILPALNKAAADTLVSGLVDEAMGAGIGAAGNAIKKIPGVQKIGAKLVGALGGDATDAFVVDQFLDAAKIAPETAVGEVTKYLGDKAVPRVGQAKDDYLDYLFDVDPTTGELARNAGR